MRELGEKKHARGQLFFHTTRSDCGSSRSYHAFGLPKLHRCFECVSVTVRVFRSEDFKKTLFLHHLFERRTLRPNSLPTLHRYFVCMSVSVRAGRSEDLKKTVFLLSSFR